MKRIDSPKFFNVGKYEENGSNVNFVAYLRNDCWCNHYEKALVISNDSDIVIAMEMVRVRSKVLGLVSPNKKYCPFDLKKHASFRKNISKKQLQKSQFSEQITDHQGKIILKPSAWNPKTIHSSIYQ